MTVRVLAALVLGFATMHAVAAKPPPGNGWLLIETVGAQRDTVAQLYREQLLAWYRASNAMDAAELAQLPKADHFTFRPDLTRFSIGQGKFAGLWSFVPPSQGRWPDSAVQIVDRSDAGNYRILARLYCDAATPACRKLREETAAMAAPEPSIGTNSAGYAAWQQLVMTEACRAGPKQMPAPRYPASLARSGKGGTVALRLLVNPCGEVRAVRLDESSGIPLLDQAAINTAWDWRLYPQRQATGALMRVPVDFVPPQLSVAPSNRLDRANR